MRLHSLGSVTSIARLGAGTIGSARAARGIRMGTLVPLLMLGLSLVPEGAGAQGTVNATTQGGAQGELGVKAQPALSNEEQLAQADAISRRGNQLAERLTRMLDEARRDKDILRASCVNRKLTEVNANVRNVDQRARALKDAVQTGDEGRRDHEYTVLTVLSQKLDTLNQEASQCLGESIFQPGASQVITTIPANAPTLDPTAVPPPPPPPAAFTVPPPVSPVS